MIEFLCLLAQRFRDARLAVGDVVEDTSVNGERRVVSRGVVTHAPPYPDGTRAPVAGPMSAWDHVVQMSPGHHCVSSNLDLIWQRVPYEEQTYEERVESVIYGWPNWYDWWDPEDGEPPDSHTLEYNLLVALLPDGWDNEIWSYGNPTLEELAGLVARSIDERIAWSVLRKKAVLLREEIR